MRAAAFLGLLGAVMALGWRRRGGGLLPLVLAVGALSPIALAAWLSAEWSRRWLARPARLRRSLEAVGLADYARDWTPSARRISKGRMNAVLLVTLKRKGETPRQLVLKHLLRFGTLLGWGSRLFGATPEYPRTLGRRARTTREVRALQLLGEQGFPVPRCLGFNLEQQLVAMEYVEGAPLAVELALRPNLAGDLGRLIAKMHAIGYSMGDPIPENMAVDRLGRIVPFDLEQSHFDDQTTWRRKGFDLAWAAAFLPGDIDRAHFFDAYGARTPALDEAVGRAQAHLLRFAPITERVARRWRRAESPAPAAQLLPKAVP